MSYRVSSLVRNLFSQIKTSNNERNEELEFNGSFSNSSKSHKRELKQKKLLEIEDTFLSELKFIMEKKEMNYYITENLVIDKKFTKYLSNLSQTLEIYAVEHKHLLTFLEYYRVVKHLILLLNEFVECNQASIIEFYGRKQIDIFKAHQDHALIYCVKINKMFYLLVNICFHATDSDLFLKRFSQNGGTAFLMNYLFKSEFVSDCMLVIELATQEKKNIINLFQNMLLTVLKLTNVEDMSMYKTGLLTFCEIVRSEENFLFLTYMILGKIFDESEKKILPDQNIFIQKLNFFLKISADSVRAHGNIKKEIELNGECSVVSLINLKSFSINIIELLDAVYNFELFNLNRIDLFECLVKIIMNGNDVEAEFSLKLLFQFSFHEYFCSEMAKNEILKLLIKRIIAYQYPNQRLLQYSEGLAWRIENHKTKPETNKSSDLNQVVDPFCIMPGFNKLKTNVKCFISFEYFDTIMCNKIRDKLKELGIQVWLNDNSKKQFKFDKKILAIEKSDIIILCKYYLFINFFF